MSNIAVSASTQTPSTTLLGDSRGSPRRVEHGERDESDGGNQQRITLFASLLQALIQAATVKPATPTTATASTTAVPSGTAASAATSAAAATTGSAATAAPPSSANSAPSTLVRDLQAFLHDLFHALRQANRSGNPSVVVTTPTTSTTAAAPATATAAATSTTPPVIKHYAYHGILDGLKALIQDLGTSQPAAGTVSTPGASTPGASANILSTLNAAFEKLIGDLAGSPSSASGSSAQSTTALQAFLTNFLNDLQANQAATVTPLGSSIDATA